jgi:hypothetical protein
MDQEASRANSRPSRPAAALALLMLMVCGSGCEFGRQWFQMSSDSQMPFFGLDILPRRNSTRSIAAGEDDEISIQTADDRQAGRSGFEPRIIPTREVDPQPLAESRDIIELPELRGRTRENGSAQADTFSQPFPEAIELSAE